MRYNYISVLNRNRLHVGVGYGGPWLLLLRAKIGQRSIEVDAATYKDAVERYWHTGK